MRNETLWMFVMALVLGVICAALAARYARWKNRDVTMAVLLGLTLGLLGVLIVALLPSKAGPGVDAKAVRPTQPPAS